MEGTIKLEKENKKGKSNFHRLSISLSPKIYEDMRYICFRERISFNKYIQQSIKNNIEKDLDDITKISYSDDRKLDDDKL